MDISEVAQRTGVPASTLRFYEKKGLIAAVGRRGLRRLFTPDVLERLALIALGRAAGFSLDEIAPMVKGAGRPRIDRHMLAAKAEELSGEIRRLSAIRDGLRHAAACPAASHLDCPTFRRLLEAAAVAAAKDKTRAWEASPRRREAFNRAVSRAERRLLPSAQPASPARDVPDLAARGASPIGRLVRVSRRRRDRR